jgi:hypothetical protein
MKKLILPLTLALFSYSSFAFPVRVTEIPNGSKFGCQNCHMSPSGGDALNPFGEQVASGGITSGRVDWSKLWDKDADGDGFTNGQELGDPNGDWSIGDPNPGDIALVTRPWDSDDFPASVNADEYFASVTGYPNPFYNTIQINTESKKPGLITVEVVDLTGNLIKTIVNSLETPGEKVYYWDGTTENGSFAPKGMYFVRIIQEDAFKTLQVVFE